MIPEIGHFALVLALVLALTQGVLPLLGLARGDPASVALARAAAHGQFVFLLFGILCLAASFVANDFSVSYVAQHSNSALPLVYRISAVWGGHEGSLLLWAFILSGWGTAVSLRSAALPASFVARVLAVMGLVGAGFELFMLLTSNPFDRLLPAAVEGVDLNPLLQDPLLAIHPPMLYMGYVGFSVAYGFAMAGLLEGRFDAAWARWSRPWTLAAWVCLSLGICLGSFWAYYELGWGGWWFWDPVENASFMPWLAGTALIHSLAVTEKRGCFRNWTVILAILAFGLSLLGTFLVRSGVLTSVHAFATDPARGMFVLAFLGTTIGVSLALYAWRAPRIAPGGSFAVTSRETLLLANNVLLSVATATVLLGTLYPLVLDALGLGKISVGPPYFKAVFVPVMSPLVFMMAIGPHVRWKRAELPELGRRLRWALAVGLVAAVLPVVRGGSPWIGLGCLLSSWVVLCVAFDFVDRARRLGEGTFAAGLRRLPRAYLGMACAHLGIAVFVFGVTISGGYSVETDRRVGRGETVELAGYGFTFEGTKEVTGPNYFAEQGRVVVRRDGREVAVLEPQKRRYSAQGRVMTEAAIDPGFTRHLYVALGEPLDGGAWGLRLYVKPAVQWIWVGVVFMALGGSLAASDRRYRLSLARMRPAPSAVSPSVGAIGVGA
ncbi:MAG: heme lyase CcmF/NrfE family subunit [Gammaproteobacteria bacterium]|nr:heme lyase CcmF/NrfE family subunit [Gammaproteobacteria bacterium]MBI5615882.1 heme lyase CcmF/NrfE family subunit [Gammaproteobacteria bacterium]